jgi:hypothetical protein
MDAVLQDHAVDVLLHSVVVGATRQDNIIRTVDIQDRRGGRKIRSRASQNCQDGDRLIDMSTSSSSYRGMRTSMSLALAQNLAREDPDTSTLALSLLKAHPVSAFFGRRDGDPRRLADGMA